MSYYVVTGAAGFIGSRLVAGLNRRGVKAVIAVDNLQHSGKFANLVDCEIADYIDQAGFVASLEKLQGDVEAVFHQGACSDTMESDGRYMMENNYEYSRRLLDWCLDEEVPLIYASSASVYGAGPEFREERRCEKPLNIYGYSKFLFDQYVRSILDFRMARRTESVRHLESSIAARDRLLAHGRQRRPPHDVLGTAVRVHEWQRRRAD